MIAESLNIPRTLVLRIQKEDLGKRKLCARCVPHSLTPVQREDPSHILPRHYRDGRCRQKFLTKFITGDETWCFAYDYETKRQSSEWVGETSPRPKKLKFRRSRIDTMLIAFIDSHGAVHKEFVSEGKTVNVEFYNGVTDSLLKLIQLVRPAAFCSSDIFLVAR